MSKYSDPIFLLLKFSCRKIDTDSVIVEKSQPILSFIDTKFNKYRVVYLGEKLIFFTQNRRLLTTNAHVYSAAECT